MGNSFAKPTLDAYHELSHAVYSGAPYPAATLDTTPNPAYWRQLHDKCAQIHREVQEKSRSINKAFGIFNEATLRHCSTNIAQDIEGYKALIARPYESVNRAMPGSCKPLQRRSNPRRDELPTSFASPHAP